MNNPLCSRRTFLYSLGGLAFAGSSAIVLNKFALNNKVKEISQSKILMGTFVSISLKHEDYSLLENALESAFTTIENAQKIFTRHEADSPLALLNAQGKVNDAPKELIMLLDASIKLANASNNAFNPAILPSLEALERSNLSRIADLPKSMQKELDILTNPKNISIKNNSIKLASTEMAISLDAIAKGHIVDLAAIELEKFGIFDYMINAGGDIRVNSSKESEAWNIAILDAKDKSKYTEVLSLHKGAIATSANYDSLEHKGYEHLIASSTGILSMTALAPTCQEADALATAFFAMGEDRAKAYIKEHTNYSYRMQNA